MKLNDVLFDRKISRNQLALKAGINPSDLYRAMSGKCTFYPGWKKRISDFLNIPEAELFEEVEQDV